MLSLSSKVETLGISHNENFCKNFKSCIEKAPLFEAKYQQMHLRNDLGCESFSGELII